MLGEVQQPINYGQPVNYLQDALLSGQTQTAMQQKYDVNTAKLESIVDQISSVPIQQQAGKKYLMDKLQGVLNTVSSQLKVSNGKGILSNAYTSGLVSQIKGSIDNTVKKHIKYSQDIINFEQGVAKLKEKDPKLYNQANYDFSKYKAGLNEYLAGDVNADLGSLQYTPYKDVMGDALKKAKEIKDLKGDQEIETVSSDGTTIIKRKISGLTPEEVIKYIPGILDNQDEQQIMIDGWSDVRYTKDKGISQISDYFNQKKSILEKEIVSLEAISKTNSTDEEYNIAQERIKNYKDQIIELDSQDVSKMSQEQIGYILKKQQVLNNMKGLFSGRESITYDVNPIWKENNDLAYKQANLDIEREKLNIERAKSQKEGLKQNQDGSYSIDATQGVSSSPVTDQTYEDLTPEDIVENVQKNYNTNYNNLISEITETFSTLSDSSPIKKAFIANMDKYGFNYNKTSETFSIKKGVSATKAGSMYQAYIDSKMNSINPEQETRLIDIENERVKLSKIITEAKDKAFLDAKKEYSSSIFPSKKLIPGTAGFIPSTEMPSDFYIKSNVPKEYIGKHLKDLGAVRNIVDRNNLTISGDKVTQITNLLPSDSISGDTFDSKSPITIFKNDNSNTYIIKQFKGIDKDGNRKEAIATVPVNAGSLGSYLNSITATEEKFDSVLDYNIGEPIKPSRKPTIASKINDSVQTNMVDAMKVQIKDEYMVRDLANFTVKPYSAFILKKALIEKGIEESIATTYATNLVNKVSNGSIQPNIVPEKTGWFVDINGVKVKIGDTDKLSKDVSYAIKLYPAQSALSILHKQISEYSLEELNSLYGDNINNLFK